MATTTRTEVEDPLGDIYVQLSGVSWKTFEGLARRSRGGRLTYDAGELEIISPSIYHEDFGARLRELVFIAAERIGIRVLGVGSTTWKAPAKMKGVEADAAFYLDPRKVNDGLACMKRGEKQISQFPPPDLIIEIDMRRPSRSRRRIYAAIGAVEVWLFDGKRLVIEQLGENGEYSQAVASRWFPIPAELICRTILDPTPMDETSRRHATREFVARFVPSSSPSPEAKRTDLPGPTAPMVNNPADPTN
jgi:Uma2 family endonuclease